jgi:hypothetical protein
MGESALLRCPSSPVFTLHYSVVGGGTSERNPSSLIVRAHAGKCTAAGNPSFEVIDVRRFKVWSGGLIVAAILIKPGNWVRVRAAIRGFQGRVLRREDSGANRKWEQRQSARFYDVSSAVVLTHFCKQVHVKRNFARARFPVNDKFVKLP